MAQVVLITGCSSGLGFSLAKTLAEEGYLVYATMRNLKNMPKLIAECRVPGNLKVRKLDVTNKSDIATVVEEIIQADQTIDILIHNAAQILIGPVDSATEEETRSLFESNVFGVLNLTQKTLPYMRQQNQGHIIFISSISGVESAGYLGIYSATKFAIEGIAASLATTLALQNIKVSVVQPGAMNTNIPVNIKIGSYYCGKDDPYKVLNKASYHLLKEVLGKGKDPLEVSQLILQAVIQNEKPSFKTQTCDYSHELVKKHLVDPRGNAWINEHQEFLKSLI